MSCRILYMCWSVALRFSLLLILFSVSLCPIYECIALQKEVNLEQFRLLHFCYTSFPRYLCNGVMQGVKFRFASSGMVPWHYKATCSCLSLTQVRVCSKKGEIKSAQHENCSFVVPRALNTRGAFEHATRYIEKMKDSIARNNIHQTNCPCTM